MKNRERTCPDPERLAEYLDGTLSATQRKALEEHLVSCSDCRDVVAETALSVEEIRSAGVTPSAWTRISSKRVTGAAGALAAAATLVVAIRVYESANDAKRDTTTGPTLDTQTTTTDKLLPSAGTIAIDAKRDTTTRLLPDGRTMTVTTDKRLPAPSTGVIDTLIAELHASPEWQAFRQSLEKEETRPVSGRLTGLPYIRPATREGGSVVAGARAIRIVPRADGALAERRRRETRAAAEKLMAVAESNPRFRPAAGPALLTLGNPGSAEEAIRRLTEVLRDESGSASVWNDLAVAYLAHSDLVQGEERSLRLNFAVNAAQRAMDLNPMLREPYFNYALALERQRRFEAAAKAWQAALEHETEPDWANEVRSHLPALGPPLDVVSELRHAMGLLDSRECRSASLVVTNVLVHEPQNAEALALIGRVEQCLSLSPRQSIEKPPVVPPSVIQPTEPRNVPIVTGRGDVKPVIPPDEFAKTVGIPELLNKYCPAQESRDPTRVRAIQPSADMAVLKKQFSQFASIKCEIAEQGTWKFVQVDGANGTAHVQVEVKQTYVGYRGGGAPEVNETIADFFMARPSERTDWQIVKVAHRPKPKP